MGLKYLPINEEISVFVYAFEKECPTCGQTTGEIVSMYIDEEYFADENGKLKAFRLMETKINDSR